MPIVETIRRGLRASCLVGVVVITASCSDHDGPQVTESGERADHQATVKRLMAQLAQHPNDASLLRQLGSEHWKLGDLDEAELSFKKSLVEQGNYDTQLSLVSLLYRRGRYLEADALAKRVVATNKDAVPDWLNQLRRKFDQSRSRESLHGGQLTSANGAFVNSIGVRFVEVPGGSFVRGDDGGEPSNRPARSITVSPYAIGQFEVTAGQFKQFVDETNYPFHRFIPRMFEPKFSEYPVAAVSWLDAEAFAIWLSNRENSVYRLPTEAEWELAARGINGYREPWGNDNGRKQVDGNWGHTPRDYRDSMPPLLRVGSFPRDRSPFGAFDMAGNVKEWCLDEFDSTYYSWSPSRNPFGPVEQTGLKVLRGGNWMDQGPGGFAIQRSKASQSQQYTGYGFRLVREH